MKTPVVALAMAAMFGLAMPARADLIVLSGTLDASQVVAPVYQTDASGNQVLDANGNPIVIGSSPTNPDGTPASTSTATGLAIVFIDTQFQTIETDLTWAGLSGPTARAHLHDAPAGVTRLLDPPNNRFFREVIRDESVSLADQVDCGSNLEPAAATSCAPASGSLVDFLQLDDTWFDPTGQFGLFTDFDALLAAFKADGLFLDIHTALYPGGEIRGQLLFNAVPEPATLTLLSVGLLGVLVARRRKQA